MQGAGFLIEWVGIVGKKVPRIIKQNETHTHGLHGFIFLIYFLGFHFFVCANIEMKIASLGKRSDFSR